MIDRTGHKPPMGPAGVNPRRPVWYRPAMHKLAPLAAPPLVLLLTALVVLAPACEAEDHTLPEAFAAAIPSAEIVRLDVPGAEDEALVTSQQALKADSHEDHGRWFLETIGTAREINGWTLALLGLVDEITANPFTERVDDGYVWGPFTPTLSATTIRFTLTRTATATFAFSLDVKLKGSDDDTFAPLLAGSFEGADGASESDGVMTLDFSAESDLDPTKTTTGAITFDWDTAGEGKAVDTTFVEFQDEHMEEPVTATYTYRELADQSGSFQFHLRTDVHADDPDNADLDAIEDVAVHARWIGSAAGRGDVRVTGGDLPLVDPPVASWEHSECWDEVFGLTYLQEIANLEGGDIYEGETVGDVSACPFDAAEYL